MSFNLIIVDITEIECDASVNSSNGVGYMGGKKGINNKLDVVA